MKLLRLPRYPAPGYNPRRHPRGPARMNRRDFLSAAATASLAAAAAAKDDPTMPPVVDTHQHLWDLSRIRLGWVKPDDPLNHSFTPKEYAEATQGLNVAK